MPIEPNTAFEGAVGAWLAGLGGVRDVVRQELVRRQLAEIVPPACRVLDVGCGQGTQALHLARSGHDVTGLDPSDDLLAAFRDAIALEPAEVAGRINLVQASLEDAPGAVTGRFDLVLCHGVLMYFDDVASALVTLDRLVTEGGRLSLLVRNGLAPAMRDGLRGRWPEALAAFDSLDYVNRLGVPAHAHTPEQLDALSAPLGWRRGQWYGVRVFTDHHDQTPPPEDGLADLIDAEEEAGRRDPYRQVAGLLHLVYDR